MRHNCDSCTRVAFNNSKLKIGAWRTGRARTCKVNPAVTLRTLPSPHLCLKKPSCACSMSHEMQQRHEAWTRLRRHCSPVAHETVVDEVQRSSPSLAACDAWGGGGGA